MWKEAGLSGENPRAQAGEHHTLLQTTTVDKNDRTWVTVVESECIVHFASWTTFIVVKDILNILLLCP